MHICSYLCIFVCTIHRLHIYMIHLLHVCVCGFSPGVFPSLVEPCLYSPPTVVQSFCPLFTKIGELSWL